MAKKTKFKNDNEATNEGAATSTATTPQDVLQSTVCNNNNNTDIKASGDASTLNPEDEQFSIVMNNIVSSDDYIKFTELANMYNLFNGYTLDLLCKQDLICLIGSVINRLYISELTSKRVISECQDEILKLNTKVQHLENQKPENSFNDKSMSYSDLMGTLGEYKSW